MTTFVNNLKTLRKAHRLSQEQFGEKVNIKRPTIGAYEEGRAEPSITKFLEICGFFNVKPEEFYTKELRIETTIKQ